MTHRSICWPDFPAVSHVSPVFLSGLIGLFTNRLLWLGASAGAVPLRGSGCRNLALPGIYEQALTPFPAIISISFLQNLTHATDAPWSSSTGADSTQPRPSGSSPRSDPANSRPAETPGRADLQRKPQRAFFGAWNAVANLTDVAGTVTVSIHAEKPDGFDSCKLHDGVIEPPRSRFDRMTRLDSEIAASEQDRLLSDTFGHSICAYPHNYRKCCNCRYSSLYTYSPRFESVFAQPPNTH